MMYIPYDKSMKSGKWNEDLSGVLTTSFNAKIAFELYDTKAYITGTHTFDHGLMVVEIDMTTYEIDTFREKRRTKPLSLNQ